MKVTLTIEYPDDFSFPQKLDTKDAWHKGKCERCLFLDFYEDGTAYCFLNTESCPFHEKQSAEIKAPFGGLEDEKRMAEKVHRVRQARKS